MAWVETESLSFLARHETEDAESAQRTLDALEDLRLRLEDRFDDAPGEITVIIHPTPAWLAAAHPFLPAGGARRDHPRRHNLRDAAARARPRRLRRPGLAPAARRSPPLHRARVRRAGESRRKGLARVSPGAARPPRGGRRARG